MKYPRPDTPTVTVVRADVDGTCPECGAAALKAYQVLSEGGWFNVVKCQACLASVARVADPDGPVTLLSAARSQ